MLGFFLTKTIINIQFVCINIYTHTPCDKHTDQAWLQLHCVFCDILWIMIVCHHLMKQDSTKFSSHSRKMYSHKNIFPIYPALYICMNWYYADAESIKAHINSTSVPTLVPT